MSVLFVSMIIYFQQHETIDLHFLNNKCHLERDTDLNYHNGKIKRLKLDASLVFFPLCKCGHSFIFIFIAFKKLTFFSISKSMYLISLP